MCNGFSIWHLQYVLIALNMYTCFSDKYVKCYFHVCDIVLGPANMEKIVKKFLLCVWHKLMILYPLLGMCSCQFLR